MRSRTIMFLCSTLLAAAPAAAQERMYKCVDAKGKVYYTQVPPPECLGRDTQELNKSGTLIRENPAALSPAQVQARDAERNKNLSLINTYSSEKDIEDARTRALKEAQGAIADTERFIAGAKKRGQELEAEKEFYVKKKEISKINAKYDEDKRRYVELTSGKAASQRR